MSWSYQSTNPCTVLVKEKQDGLSSSSRDCPPPILQSSTETVVSSQDQPEISSSLGNSVGGKKRREKRQAHEDAGFDVVFDNGDGHEYEPKVQLIEKRILVNISIAMDSGINSPQQEIYQIQVAVPLPKQEEKASEFYSYNVGESQEQFMDFNETFTSTPDFTNESSTSYDDESISSSTISEGSNKTNLNESGMQLMDHDDAKMQSRELSSPLSTTLALTSINRLCFVTTNENVCMRSIYCVVHLMAFSTHLWLLSDFYCALVERKPLHEEGKECDERLTAPSVPPKPQLRNNR